MPNQIVGKTRIRKQIIPNKLALLGSGVEKQGENRGMKGKFYREGLKTSVNKKGKRQRSWKIYIGEKLE